MSLREKTWPIERLFRWSCLRIFECPAVNSPHVAMSVYEEPFGDLTAPDRFKRGDVAIVCHEDSTIVGYTWLSFKDLWVSECRLFLSVNDDEAVSYGAFVFPQYRGRGLYTRIESAALAEAARRGREKVITYVERDNKSSLRTQQRLAKSQMMSLYSIHVFNRFSVRWSSSGPLTPRFHK